LDISRHGDKVKTISLDVLLESELISKEDTQSLSVKFASHPVFTAAEILELDLPAMNRVDALLQPEFLSERQLRELACDFAEHTLPIFESRTPRDRRPRKCLEIARLHLTGAANSEELQKAISEAIPAVWRFDKTEFTSAFEAGLVTTFLDYKDAAELARIIAKQTQRAAHLYLWEQRKSNVEPMLGRELEACWQLKRIVTKIRGLTSPLFLVQ
jgi:hypothetical protein